jgi:hypothetical protein
MPIAVYAHECVVLWPAAALVQASDGAAPAATGAGWPKLCRTGISTAYTAVA